MAYNYYIKKNLAPITNNREKLNKAKIPRGPLTQLKRCLGLH